MGELFDSSLEQPYYYRVETLGILNYALAQSSLPLVSEIGFLNNQQEEIKGLKIEIEFDYDFVKPAHFVVDKIESGKSYELKPEFEISSRKIFELSELVKDKMTIRFILNEIELFKDIKDLYVFPLNQWSGTSLLPESLAAFVTPNIPVVKHIQQRASQILGEMTGSSSIDGYQSQDKNRVRMMMASIFAAIAELNITYAKAPSSFTTLGQIIRTPQEVIDMRLGNCVEMSILFSAVAEACGLNPFVVLMEGHAFCGCWLEENFFDTNVTTDLTSLTKRIVSGINEIEVFESTYMNQGMGKTFEQGVRSARDLLDERFEAVIDIRRSHMLGFRPMPLRVLVNDEVKLVDYGLAEDASDLAEITKSVEDYFIDTSVKKEVDKREVWLRNLLDLSKRNSLISFRPGSKSVQIFNSDLSKLEDALSKGDSFDVREVVEDWVGAANRMKMIDVESQIEVVDKISQAEFKAKRLRTFLSKDELGHTLKTIYRDTNHSIEESGASSLFLAMGFLKWKDPKEYGEQIERYAPIVLLPIDLIRKSVESYQIRLRDEDAQLNVTLLEMLRQKFDLSINGLDPLPEDENGVDLTLIFNSIRKAVMKLSDWDVVEVAVISNFSFSQFVLYNDLRTRFDRLMESKVVSAFVNGRYQDNQVEELDIYELDNQDKVGDVLIPTSVDSSQLMAVIEATKGNSFVLHGPPGTGKSQTITNMIANALYHNKSVLFVAEKMAALNVVHQRLSKIGLGDFCLEIHSNKIQKRDVLEKLHQCLQLKRQNQSMDYQRKSEQIQQIKTDLKAKFDALKMTRNVGYSLYDLLEKYFGISQDCLNIIFTEDSLRSIDRVKLETIDLEMKNLEGSVKEIGIPKTHPLSDFKKSGFAIHLVDGVKNNLEKLSELLTVFSGSHLSKVEYLDRIDKVGSVIVQRNLKIEITPEVWARLQDTDLLELMRKTVILGKQNKQAEALVLSRYTRDVLSLNTATIKEEYLRASNKLLFKNNKKRDALVPLNSLAINGFVVSEANAIAELDLIADWQNHIQLFEQQVEQINLVLHKALDGTLDKLDGLEDLLALKETTLSPEFYPIPSDGIYQMIYFIQKTPIQQDMGIYHQIKESYLALAKVTGLPPYLNLPTSQWLPILQEKVELWRTHIGEWKDWSLFYQRVEMMEGFGFGEFISYLFEEDEVANLHLRFMKTLYRAYIHLYLGDSKALATFSGNDLALSMQHYNQFINEYESLCKTEIMNRIIDQIPNPRTCSDLEAKQLADIQRAIQSKGRGYSIRKIFHQNSEVIKKLTPCFLMSPLSVSQYIDLEFPKFDLVIFDEASQIQTAFAVGAISRADNCIVVGDPNQMPPTTFFSSTKLDEENIMVEDLESLLEDCLAVNMPQRYLTCHYRSQSESLIAFSNKMYYQGKMQTFPSTQEMVSSVRYIPVDGVYDRGHTRTNEKEAKSIVDDIIKRLKEGRKETLGVVTFNIMQQNLIDDLLQKEFAKDKALEKLASELKESIFIKNIENVQGDERDIILFSMTYGKDESGKFYQNFGPVAKKGGWRRLNVAVTRSRLAMLVFSSISYMDITVHATSSEGVRGVRKFLEYAQKGSSVLAGMVTKSKETLESEMIDNIQAALEKEGYVLHRNIGDSNFSVPLGILNTEDNASYSCGILIDNDSFGQIPTIRDKIRVFSGVLEGKGWNIYRIWAIDWYLDSQRELDKLKSYLESKKIGLKQL